jgi:hypothetical protein
MRLPKSVYVMGHEYKIETMSKQLFEDMDAYGDCSDDKRRIRIYVDTSTGIIRDTLLHEILHACWYLLGLSKQEEEEKVVNSISTLLIGVLDDPRNKDVVDLILSK